MHFVLNLAALVATTLAEKAPAAAVEHAAARCLFALGAMLLAPVYGLLAEVLYNNLLAQSPAVVALFGPKLNFMHRVFLTFLLSSATLIGLSGRIFPNTNPDGFARLRVDVNAGQVFRAIGLFLAIQAVFLTGIFAFGLSPKTVAGWAALAVAAERQLTECRSRLAVSAEANLSRSGGILARQWGEPLSLSVVGGSYLDRGSPQLRFHSSAETFSV